MTWEHHPAAENQLSSQELLGKEQVFAGVPVATSLGSSGHSAGSPSLRKPEISVGKRMGYVGGKDIEVFTMSLGSETIDLLPLKTWAQLDLYKWRVQGKLPGTPAGLEVAFDHIKLLGQTVKPDDPEACAKLEHLFAEWLAMEKETLELAKRRTLHKAVPQQSAATPEAGDASMQFQVELDKKGQVHIHCVKGKEVLATIGLNAPGFQSLISQGWMRKPHSLKIGALHDWVELDGVLYSFEKGADSSAALAKVLNENYLPPATLGKDKAVVLYANAASSTGFDIQFPAKSGGVLENRRRPLGEESLALLQDTDHCGLLRPGLVIKLSRPYFIFKQKTPDGGERYLEKCAENEIRISDDDGGQKLIDLSQPVNYLKHSVIELTAIFNHPSINRHAQTAQSEPSQSRTAPSVVATKPPLSAPVQSAQNTSHTADTETHALHTPAGPQQKRDAAVSSQASSTWSPPTVAPSAEPAQSAMPAVSPPRTSLPLPNLWLKRVLEQQPIRFDWFTCLIYGKIATWVGNSNQGRLLESECWFVQLGETTDLADPGFRGIFDTANGSFGFLGGEFMLRFDNAAAFLGKTGSELKAPDIRPLAIGMDSAGTPIFVVNDGYRSRFAVPEPQIAVALAELKEHGANLMSVKEIYQSHEPLEVIWTVPAQQSDPAAPEALEHLKPE